MTILNARRLRDYPRLMFITIWLILVLNLVLRQGWLGGFNQIIGSDFITLYSAGFAYRTDVSHLYDLQSQFDIQQALIQPTQLPGVNPYISPPYVAEFYSLFTYLPLQAALIIWTLISLVSAIAAGYIGYSLLPKSLIGKLPVWQLLIIILSFFPFIEGLQAGQNHTLTLLLVSGMLLCILSDHWHLAGLMGGLLIYKPQLVLGFLIIWLVWRKFKALGAFLATAAIWVASDLIIHGIKPYQAYLSMSRDLLSLPYVQGFPGYLLTTFYGLLTSIFSTRYITITSTISLVLVVAFLLFLAWQAYLSRSKPVLETTPIIVLAMIFPVLAFPYSLLHDLVILIPAFLLWARYSTTDGLKYTAIGVYLGCFFLTLVAAVTRLAIMPIIPLVLFVLIILDMRKPPAWIHVGEAR